MSKRGESLESLGRHRAGKGRQNIRWGPVVAFFPVVAMVAGGAYAIRSMTSDDKAASNCGGPSVTVEAAPEMAEVVASVMADCDNVEVKPTPSAETAQKVAAGEDTPDVWIPDSSVWEARVTEQAPVTPQRLVESLASSPIVIVSQDSEPPTWSDLLKEPDLILGDPLTSIAAVVPLAGAGSESDLERSSQLIVPVAQAQPEDAGEVLSDTSRIEAVADGKGVTTISEQALLDRGSELTMSVPTTGTTFLDYPVLLTTPENRRADIEPTTKALTTALRSTKLQKAVAAAKFRPTGGATIDDGVPDIKRLPLPNAQDLSALLGRWGTFTRPGWLLAVVDVSGSMDFESGRSTRIDVLADSLESGLKLFPDTAGIGVWVFSEKLKGDKDYRQLLSTKKLDEKVGSGTQRDAIVRTSRELPGMTTGGTGLYDTLLAAYRSAQANWNPRAFNSVAVFTDGENDDPGSISKEQLLSELKRLADPAKPIAISAFGITKDSDMNSLKQIAAATGGGAYEVLDPTQMTKYIALTLSGQAT